MGKVTRGKQAGFTLIESIFIVAMMLILGYTIYHFGWGSTGKAGEGALKTDLQTIQISLTDYVLASNGLYPTEDRKLPDSGKYKLIFWDTSYNAGSQSLSFYPDHLKKLPKHWNEGVWRIDSVGKVSITINPQDY